MTSTPSPPDSESKVACGYCGHDNDSGVRFCGECGRPLRASAARVQPAFTPDGGVRMPVSAGSETVAEGLRCRKCGSTVNPTEPFCAHCGTKVVDKVEAGEEVVITRRGHPVARITCNTKPLQPVKSLADLRARLPKARRSSAKLIRQLRDEGY